VKTPSPGLSTDLSHASAGEVTQELLERARRVRVLVLDVDGVLTDGRLHITAQGEETKVFHVRDGSGIVAVQRAGITVAIISGRDSAAVTRRAAELGIRHVYQGISDKGAALDALLAELGVAPDALACVGDDTPDVPMLERATLAVAVADAHATARAAAHWTTLAAGGHGAVREVCDLLLSARAS
jgi:3-deoxy-D-manno-octulosonate 8-phosphate phosphatase (KDO 8-P phosphatase)